VPLCAISPPRAVFALVPRTVIHFNDCVATIGFDRWRVRYLKARARSPTHDAAEIRYGTGGQASHDPARRPDAPDALPVRPPRPARANFSPAPDKTQAFAVTVDLGRHGSVNPFDFFADESAVRWPFVYEPELAAELRPYLESGPAEPLLNDYVKSLAAPGRDYADVGPSAACCSAAAGSASRWRWM
jgi:hypothetical protein